MDASLGPPGASGPRTSRGPTHAPDAEVQARMSAVITGFATTTRLRQLITDNEHTLALLQAMEAMDVDDRSGWTSGRL